MTTANQSRRAAGNVVVSESDARVMAQAAAAAQRAIYTPSADDVRRQVENLLLSQLDKARTAASTQMYEPTGAVDIFVIGPIQATPPALQPAQVIAVGETAFVITVLFLNPLPIWSGLSPLNVLEGFNLNCTLQYSTGNLSTWTLAEPGLQQNGVIALSPGGGLGGGPFYVDVQAIAPTQEGIHELNIASRILGAGPGSHFAGFATWTLDLDPDFIATVLGLAPASPGFFNKAPVRYDVYQP